MTGQIQKFVLLTQFLSHWHFLTLKNSSYIHNTYNKYRSDTLSLSSVHHEVHFIAQTTDQR